MSLLRDHPQDGRERRVPFYDEPGSPTQRGPLDCRRPPCSGPETSLSGPESCRPSTLHRQEPRCRGSPHTRPHVRLSRDHGTSGVTYHPRVPCNNCTPEIYPRHRFGTRTPHFACRPRLSPPCRYVWTHNLVLVSPFTEFGSRRPSGLTDGPPFQSRPVNWNFLPFKTVDTHIFLARSPDSVLAHVLPRPTHVHMFVRKTQSTH